jgi:hypothetical protein
MAFIDRAEELAFFSRLQERGGPQLILLFGRRRIGKSALMRHWAETSGIPHTYWAAVKEPAALQRRKLFSAVFGGPATADFETWAECFEAVARVIGDQRHILLLDELPYAAEVDSAVLSSLQNAWDHQFKRGKAIIVLCGSHVTVMERLLALQSPLYGRFTGQWRLRPLSFRALHAFSPLWTAEERVAIYATVGGIPAYLEWLEPKLSYNDNLRHVLLAPGSLFAAEPEFLLQDELREPRNHLAILKAIGAGAHTLAQLQQATTIEKTHLSSYLARLQELYLVERRVPATVHPKDRERSRKGRYHLSDPYFRFYFRFLAPYIEDLAYKPEQVLPGIYQQLKAHVGLSAWEELSRQWVEWAASTGKIGFVPEKIGAHWGDGVQIDVVAVSWTRKHMLLGESRWGKDPVGPVMLRDLIAKAGRVVPDQDWQVRYAIFSRAGFTASAQREAEEVGALLVGLDSLDADIGVGGS